MEKKYIFTCDLCGTTVENRKPEHAPQCCGKTMKKAEPMDHCRISETAEHARLQQAVQPCDDGRAGNRQL